MKRNTWWHSSERTDEEEWVYYKAADPVVLYTDEPSPEVGERYRIGQ